VEGPQRHLCVVSGGFDGGHSTGLQRAVQKDLDVLVVNTRTISYGKL
jgi:hypothetical protein